MPQFTFVFRGGGYASPGSLSPTELQQHLGRWTAWTEVMEKAGLAPAGKPLAHGGKTVRGKEKVVTDGPYAESKDLVSGTVVIEVSSIEEAVKWSRGCPILEFEDGSVEIRPIMTGPPPV